jgi:hypothetical protein
MCNYKGSMRAASASRSFGHASASRKRPSRSGLATTALPQRPCSSGPAACCCADAVGAVLPRFRRHRQPLEPGTTNAAHTLVLTDVGDTGCRGHSCPVKSEGVVCCPCRTLAMWHSIGPFLPWGQPDGTVGTKVSRKKWPLVRPELHIN